MRSVPTSTTEPATRPGFRDRRARLEALLGGLERLAVAFSGGVDSSVLLHAGRAALGEDCTAVLADSPSLPRSELEEARALAAGLGARLVVVATEELDDPAYSRNAGDRCYHCKSALFERMRAWARAHGHATLAFGEITDDLLDDRPGARAAADFGVRAPLREVGFDKRDVRRYAREVGLPVAAKPASACLASRIPTGTPVTRELLAAVETAEALVRARGFRVLRVRHHGRRALLEVGESELARARELRSELSGVLEPLGFDELDLGVYTPPALRRR